MQKHIVRLKLCWSICQSTLLHLCLFVNMSKHGVQLTWFVPTCQNTSINLYFRTYFKTRRTIDISCSNASKNIIKLTLNWPSETPFANIHDKVFEMLQIEFLRPLLPMSTAEAPTASNELPGTIDDQIPLKYDTPSQHVKRICIWGTPLGSSELCPRSSGKCWRSLANAMETFVWWSNKSFHCVCLRKSAFAQTSGAHI